MRPSSSSGRTEGDGRAGGGAAGPSGRPRLEPAASRVDAHDVSSEPLSPATDADLRRLRLVAAIGGGTAVLIGVAVLLGWALGLDGVTRVVPGLPSLMPNTAVMMCASGIVVLGEAVWPAARRARPVLLTAVATLATLTLVEYIAGVDLGVDGWLGAEDADIEFPGRPSPHTALSFALLAVALALVRCQHGRVGRIATAVAATTAFVVAAAAVGHPFGVEHLRGLSRVTGMAVHTALGLTMLSVATFALRPDAAPGSWYSRRGGGERAARRMVPGGILLPILAGAAVTAGMSWDWWGEGMAVSVMVLTTIAVFLVLTGHGVNQVRAHDRQQRLLEEESRANQRRFELLTARAPVGIFETDPPGRCTFVNPRWCEIAGRSLRAALGAEWWDPVDPDDRPRVAAAWSAAAAEGRDFAHEFRVRRADGTARWVFAHVTPLRLDDGAVTGHLGSVLDISERRAAEEATGLVVARIAEAVVVVGPDGSLVHVNDAARAIIDVLADPAGDGAVTEAGDPIAPDQRPAEITRRTGREIDDEVIGLPARDGGVRWLRVSTRVLDEQLPPPFRVVVSFTDVTARREQARALAEAEERFRRSFDDAPIGIALVAPDGRWLRVNRALCDMTGYAEGELLSRTFQDITHPDDLDADLEQLRALLAGEVASYEMEKRYITSSGEPLWVLLSVSLVRDGSGEPLYFIKQVQDITDRKRQEHELRYLSEHDVLTGLANRRSLVDDLARRLAEHGRYETDFSLVLIDLDHFKYVNDSLGHGVGDRMLRAVADVLRERLRESDLIARLGGDEFACVLGRSDRAAATLVADELVSAIRGVRVESGEDELRISASAGVACASDLPGVDADGMLAAADLAMYEAKDAGRDRYAVHHEQDGAHERAVARLNWSHRIRHALDDDRFVLHYQPIVELQGEPVRRYEALIRLDDDPDGDLVLPGTFLYIAERYGLMPAVDRWVARRVITTIASGRLPKDARVALNVSAHSLADRTLLDLVERLLAEFGVDASRLCFEVTESVAIAKLDAAKAFGRRLRRLGCDFALDDFGTGFGSFTHIKHLPVGILKIDGDFIRGLTASREDRAVVEALVHLAGATGKRTVAEYVGDEATVELLRELGVDMAQGFHLGRPAPLGELDRPADVPA